MQYALKPGHVGVDDQSFDERDCYLWVTVQHDRINRNRQIKGAGLRAHTRSEPVTS